VDDSALVALVALAMAVGVVGTVVPVVPGLALVWAAALVYGLGAGFGAVGVVAFTMITVLALSGIVAGIAMPKRAATRGGAAQWSMWLGGALGIVGFVVIPVVGLVVGGVLGVFIGEVVRTRDVTAAWRATAATIRGFGVAAVAQLAIGLTMVGVWASWVLLG
jgi:uncharacterized protein YqgC (DUF456 family)